MSKLFFVVVIFVVFASVGSAIIYNLGLLPLQAYSSLYKLEHIIPDSNSTATLPYLQKFEGHWNVSLMSSSPESNIATCVNVSGPVSIHDGQFKGTLGAIGNSVSISAKILQDGTLAGQLGTGAPYSGVVTGYIQGSSGQGTWSDSTDCNGVITFTKLEQISDPVAGSVLTLSGSVLIYRNGQADRMYPTQALYAGDKLEVPQDGSLTIILGIQKQQMNIEPGSNYTVPVQ